MTKEYCFTIRNRVLTVRDSDTGEVVEVQVLLPDSAARFEQLDKQRKAINESATD